MIQWLAIRDFAIVEQLELELDPGFTVLTGETGAGKSILIDALALLLGDRADADTVRHGQEKTEIQAGFNIGSNNEAAAWLAVNEMQADGECTLRRLVYRDKASRGFINGHAAPMHLLRELGAFLVDIHGQHEHQSLLRRETQRQILDDYAGIGAEVTKLSQISQELKRLIEQLTSIQQQSSEREARLDLLRYQTQELQTLAPQAQEFEQLQQDHRRLHHTNELLNGTHEILATLAQTEESNIEQRLNHSLTRLAELSEFDPKLSDIEKLLDEARVRVSEAATDLQHRIDDYELDPSQLAQTENRLSALHDMARKHRVEPDALPEIFEKLVGELGPLDNGENNEADLTKKIEVLKGDYDQLASRISKERSKAGKKLSAAITKQMQDLGMEKGEFAVQLSPVDKDERAQFGREAIEFQVNTNPGQPLKSLAKIASGGELSRISLAIQVITAAIVHVPTLVFDEVDVGIGGRVAEIVGTKLHSLANGRQILCITHLPQVASQGMHHFQVNKSDDDDTRVGVTPLLAKDRVTEIARMLGGVKLTRQSVAHAEEMLQRNSAQVF
ncbi:MAG: DNA repair protein RecN [Gammaproteobacteria bacterium]|nr:DNA repair protein RecN [Gammaproteobacteria bacterium]